MGFAFLPTGPMEHQGQALGVARCCVALLPSTALLDVSVRPYDCTRHLRLTFPLCS